MMLLLVIVIVVMGEKSKSVSKKEEFSQSVRKSVRKINRLDKHDC